MVGVGAGNSATTIVWRATFVMVLAWFVGWVVGAIAQKTIEDHLQSYRLKHPIPENGSAAQGIGGDSAAVEAG